MIDLKDLSALPISFNTNKGDLTFGEEILLDDSEYVPLKSLVPSLLNKSLKYPENVYHQYYNIRLVEHNKEKENNNMLYDILYLPEGLLGVEYIKSHIYFSKCADDINNTSCVVEVFYGTLTVLLQKNKNFEELSYYTEVEEGIVITVTSGEKATIPSGYFYTFINIDEKPVIFARVSKNKSTIDYSQLRKEQGLAYFCIRKNARCEVVRNPRYRNTPDINYIRANESVNSTKFSFKSPLYSEIQNQLNMFMELLWG